MKIQPAALRALGNYASSQILLTCVMSLAILPSSFAADAPAPIAKKVPKVFEEHGQKRTDPYYWLKERENPAVIDYLRQLGVTTIEIMPVHHFVPDRHLVESGLTNFWGYNTIGFFAPDVR